ncbi:hypothetical protein FOVG_18651 [Fusarium oxysporum f. sp. pisi HDV247]|uniref:Uncharacterized protein n=1 Tax=Fusarium oxysporum f. sp. pisi HDV247 TaxID=1080344 RepID=W9NB77_FUSOX|nr:hypothetical protein FOVG_18651 [Fusarium oxysporum f. sp. pisi HDV247]
MSICPSVLCSAHPQNRKTIVLVFYARFGGCQLERCPSL